MIIIVINKIYVDGKQALPYCQSVILPVRLFSLAVSCARQPVTDRCELCHTTCYLQLWAVSHNLLLTAEEHSSLIARRTVVSPPSGRTFDRTGRATPKRDCCRQPHACTVGNSCHCNNVQFITHPFPEGKELLFFSDWLVTPTVTCARGNSDETYIIWIISWYLIELCLYDAFQKMWLRTKWRRYWHVSNNISIKAQQQDFRETRL